LEIRRAGRISRREQQRADLRKGEEGKVCEGRAAVGRRVAADLARR
jgi:hypothetical protein